MSSSAAGSTAPADTGAGGDVLIRIKTLEPATYELHVDRQVTVADLKTKLEGIVQNAPAIRQRIIYRGRAPQDNQSLQELGITNGDTIHMVVRPADAPAAAPAGGGQGQAQQQPGADRLQADSRRILDQINQMMNLNLGINFNLGAHPGGPASGADIAGLGAHRHQQPPVPPQPPAVDTPHLFASLHRYLQRLEDQAYAPAPIALYSNAAPATNMQPDFEALSRAITELLAGVQLPERLAALREEARTDPAGRGPPPPPGQQQQPAGGQAHAEPEGEPGTAAQSGGRAADAGAQQADAEAGAERAQAADASAPAAAAAGGVPAGPAPRTARRAGRRRGQPAGGFDVSGASYGYRYLSLATVSLAQLLSGTEAYLTGGLAQRLRDTATEARALAVEQQQPQEAILAMRRQLRLLSGQLQATAALLVDLSRATIATSTSLNGMPLSLAANTSAAVLPEGNEAELPAMLPRRAGGRGGAAGPGGMDWGFMGMGPMGGFMDVIGAQFAMPVGAEGPGQEDAGGGAAVADGARAAPQPPHAAGMPMSGAVQIDITNMAGMPRGLGGIINNIISAVAAGAMPPGPGGQGPPQHGAAPRAAPSAAVGAAPAAAGAEGAAPGGAAPEAPQASQETPLSLLLPALTSVAGSIAASVMQSLGGRGVQPPMLLDALSRALSQHLTHVMDVLTSRWDGLQRVAARQRREARAAERARQQQQPQGAATPATGEQPSAAQPAAATDSLLEEFRPVSRLINQLFPSWESVLNVRAEPSAEEDAEEDEQADEDEEASSAEDEDVEMTEAGEGQQQQPRRGRRRGPDGAQRRADLDEDMSAIVRMLLPPMVGSIGRNVAQSVVAAVAPEAARSGSLDGQQLAMVVLQALVMRLDGVANMLFANWGRISTGIEQIESGSGASTAADMMSQMVSLAASIMGGPQQVPPPQPRAAPPPPAAQPHPQQPAAGPTTTPAPATGPSDAPPAVTAAAATLAAAPAPPAVSPATAAAAAAEQRAAAASSAPPAAASAVPAAGGSSNAAGSDGAPAAPSGSSSAPKGLGLGLRPTAPKKKPAVAAPAPPTAAGTPAEAEAAGEASRSAPSRAEASAPAQAVATRPAAGASAAGDIGSGGGGGADSLEGLMGMMGQVLGDLSSGEGGGGGGGGLGGLLQMAQSIVSDPAMQPMIGGVMNAVLSGGGSGGAGGARGGGGGGLGSLLGSLLGGLQPPAASSGGSRSAAAAAAAEPVGYDVLTEVLGSEEGGRWRELIERDVEAMQQHVQAVQEEHSANYRLGVPSRRTGLLSEITGGEGSGAEEEDEADEDEGEFEEAEEGDTGSGGQGT